MKKDVTKEVPRSRPVTLKKVEILAELSKVQGGVVAGGDAGVVGIDPGGIVCW